MKRLYLLRHSKAGQTNKKLLDDHERSLTQKGVEVCALLGNYVSEENFDLVLCSTALRAKETAELVLEQAGQSPHIELLPNLYLASPGEIFRVINQVSEEVSSVLVVGHNPGLQNLAINLAGKGDKKKFREMRNNFSPPSLAVFDIDTEWAKVGPRSGELTDFVIGKNLKRSAA